MAVVDIPLFPLRSVLFPGGTVDLRIFEQRYLDMVRDCARNDSAFGICLILDGEEVGTPAAPAAVGTCARIIDFHRGEDGLLGIRVEGGARFTVAKTRVRDNGLMHGDAQLWPLESTQQVPPEFSLLATILERLLDRMGGPLANASRRLYDDAGWVGFRLAEALPLANPERQLLLQMSDPQQRLQQLMHYLPRFQAD